MEEPLERTHRRGEQASPPWVPWDGTTPGPPGTAHALEDQLVKGAAFNLGSIQTPLRKPTCLHRWSAGVTRSSGGLRHWLMEELQPRSEGPTPVPPCLQHSAHLPGSTFPRKAQTQMRPVLLRGLLPEVLQALFGVALFPLLWPPSDRPSPSRLASGSARCYLSNEQVGDTGFSIACCAWAAARRLERPQEVRTGAGLPSCAGRAGLGRKINVHLCQGAGGNRKPGADVGGAGGPTTVPHHRSGPQVMLETALWVRALL